MLRSVPVPFIEPVAVTGKVTVSGGVPSVTVSKSHFTSVTDNGTGDFTLNLRTPFGRAPLIFGSAETTVTEGAFVGLQSSAVNATRMVTRNAAGVAADGPAHFLLLGSKQRGKDHIWPQANTLKHRRNAVEFLTFRVNGSTPAILSNFQWGTLTKNGTGDYTITFARPFFACHAFGQVTGTTAGQFSVVSCTATAVRVKTYSGDGLATATDHTFDLWVVGYRSSYDGETTGRAVKVPRLKPRFLFGQITVTGGTPALTEGAGAFTVVDNSVGVYTLTLARPFRVGVPEILTTCDNDFIAQPNTRTVSTVQLRVFQGTSNADCNVLNFAMLGYDL